MPKIQINEVARQRYMIQAREAREESKFVEQRTRQIEAEFPKGIGTPLSIQLEAAKQAELEALAIRGLRERGIVLASNSIESRKRGRVLDPEKSFPWEEPIDLTPEESERDFERFYRGTPGEDPIDSIEGIREEFRHRNRRFFTG